MVEVLLKVFFSPLMFAVGLLCPFFAQLLLALGWVSDGWLAIILGAAIAIPWGLVAQIRGSWLWLK